MEIGVAAACDYHCCVFGSDYLSDDFLDRPIEVDEPSCLCAKEIWGYDVASWLGTSEASTICKAENVRKDAFDCCKEKGTIPSNLEAGCECSIKLDCEARKTNKCHNYAENNCCTNDDYE